MAINWDRGHIHGAIAEATGVVLPVDDVLPDILITRAQEIGITPAQLKAWIYQELPDDRLRYALLAEHLAEWARRNGIEQLKCGHCGAAVDRLGEEHKCPNT